MRGQHLSRSLMCSCLVHLANAERFLPYKRKHFQVKEGYYGKVYSAFLQRTSIFERNTYRNSDRSTCYYVICQVFQPNFLEILVHFRHIGAINLSIKLYHILYVALPVFNSGCVYGYLPNSAKELGELCDGLLRNTCSKCRRLGNARLMKKMRHFFKKRVHVCLEHFLIVKFYRVGASS